MTLQDYISRYRVKNALKVSLSGIICVFISNLLHLELSYLSVLFVFLIMTQFHGYILRAGLLGLIGGFISGSMALFITYLFIDSKILYIVCMVLWLFFCMTLLSRFSLGSLLGGIIAGMSMFVAVFTSVSQATKTVEHFIAQLAIAVIVTCFVDSFIWPHRGRKTLYLTLSSVFTDYATLFHNLNLKPAGPTNRKHLSNSLSLDTFGHLLDLIKRTSQEQRDGSFPEDMFIRMVAYCKDVFLKIEFLENTLRKEHSFLNDQDITTTVKEIFDRVALHFQSMGQAVVQNSTVNPVEGELYKAIQSLENLYVIMHDKKGMDEGYYRDLLDLGAMLPIIKGIVIKLEKITTAYSAIQSGEEYTKLIERRLPRTPAVEQIKEKARFQITEDILKQSVKTVIIFLLLFLGEMFVGLPGGSQVSFFGILFGAVPNLGQAHLKGKLGIIGAVVGLLYGLVGLLFVSKVPHFMVLLLLLFLGLFVAAYTSSGTERVAFAGMQAGLLMPYVFLIYNGPQLDLNLAFTRFAALIVAATVGLLVLHFVWPVNPFTQLKDKLSTAVTRSGLILEKLLKLDEEEEDEIKALVAPLAATLPTSVSLLDDAWYVIRSRDLHSEEFVEIIESIEVIYVEFETLNKTIYSHLDSTLMNKYLSFMTPLYRRICSFFNEIGRQFQSEMNITPDIELLTQQINVQRERFRQSGVWREYEAEDVERAVLIASSIDSILSSLNKISVAINQINGVTLVPRPVEAT